MFVKRFILDGNKPIENNDSILCEIINDKGDSEIKMILKSYLQSLGILSDASTSSSTFSENVSDSSNQEKENTNNYRHRWTEQQTKYLLDQYCIYFPQIGPFRAFKTKAAMFEQIIKDLFKEFNITITGKQCLNRFKNVSKQNKKALSDNKVSGNTPSEVTYSKEYEELGSIDDSLKPEVLVGVNQVTINAKVTSDCDTSDTERQEYEKSPKRMKSNSLEQVLREISATAEENRKRRHKEKCELLMSLLGKATKTSD